jgi:hypothetical protein
MIYCPVGVPTLRVPPLAVGVRRSTCTRMTLRNMYSPTALPSRTDRRRAAEKTPTVAPRPPMRWLAINVPTSPISPSCFSLTIISLLHSPCRCRCRTKTLKVQGMPRGPWGQWGRGDACEELVDQEVSSEPSAGAYAIRCRHALRRSSREGRTL